MDSDDGGRLGGMATGSPDDYYALLGIDTEADGTELRRAWRRLALQWHPEYRALDNPISMKLFEAFAAACRSRAASRLGVPLRAAAE